MSDVKKKKKKRKSSPEKRNKEDDLSNIKKKKKGGSSQKKKTSSSKKKKTSSTVITKTLDALFLILIVVMLSGAFLFMISQKEDKTILGYRFYNVLTNSMVKTKPEQKGNFTSGDMIIVKSTPPKDIKVKDIITFVPNTQSEDTYLTHRVIQVNHEKGDNNKDKINFVTQGDANNSPDPEVDGENVIGKVILVIPKAGKGIKFVRENMLASIVFVVALFLLIFIIKGYFESIEKTKPRRKKK